MEEKTVAEALQDFINKSQLKKGLFAFQVTELWEQLMGKTIAAYTQQVEVKNHTLIVTTDVAPLRNEIMYQRKIIIERFNEALPSLRITELVIR